MIKALNKLCIEGIYHNIMKAMYDKPIANMTLKSKRVKAFPFSLRSRTQQGCALFHHLLLNILLAVLPPKN